MPDINPKATGLDSLPQMQVATAATAVEPVQRGPKKAALVSAALTSCAGALVAAAVYVGPAFPAWVSPALGVGALLCFIGASVSAALAGIEQPALPALPKPSADKPPGK